MDARKTSIEGRLAIGRQVIRSPICFGDFDLATRKPINRPMSGTVVYIHPRGLYHTVEFPLPGGPVRECFGGVG